MIPVTVGKGEVTYPHMLTKKALIIAEGGHAINLTETDWQSLYDWWDRREIVERIVRQFDGENSP